MYVLLFACIIMGCKAFAGAGYLRLQQGVISESAMQEKWVFHSIILRDESSNISMIRSVMK
jgi:hypothetical protein